MNTLEKRLSKLESIVLNKKHHGVFIILKINNQYVINNYEDKGKKFNDFKELETYILNNYDSDKYIFITI